VSGIKGGKGDQINMEEHIREQKNIKVEASQEDARFLVLEI